MIEDRMCRRPDLHPGRGPFWIGMLSKKLVDKGNDRKGLVGLVQRWPYNPTGVLLRLIMLSQTIGAEGLHSPTMRHMLASKSRMGVQGKEGRREKKAERITASTATREKGCYCCCICL